MVPAQSPAPEMPLASSPGMCLSAPSPNLPDRATQEMLLVSAIGGSWTSEPSSCASLMIHGNKPQEETVWVKKKKKKGFLKQFALPVLGCCLICSVPQCNLVSVGKREKPDNIQCSKKHRHIHNHVNAFFMPRTTHLWDLSYTYFTARMKLFSLLSDISYLYIS